MNLKNKTLLNIFVLVTLFSTYYFMGEIQYEYFEFDYEGGREIEIGIFLLIIFGSPIILGYPFLLLVTILNSHRRKELSTINYDSILNKDIVLYLREFNSDKTTSLPGKMLYIIYQLVFLD